ncbi:MAG: cation diffusion facilitator family transporter [Candidatus Hermodarchaeota archaeon]
MVSRIEILGIASLCLNIFLVILKLALAQLSGSLVLAADAIHSSVDVIASAIVLVGLVISKKKSERFPYGLYKVENVISILLAFFIFLIGYEILIEALSAEERTINTSPLIILALTVPIILVFLFSRYELYIGRKTRSPSLIADGKQYQADVLASSIVFISFISATIGLAVDRLAAIILVIFIGKAAWNLLMDGMRVLLDASIEDETLEEVKRILERHAQVREIKHIVGRNAGRFRFLEIGITIHAPTFENAHLVSEKIEKQIHSQVQNVDRISIHYSPEEKTKERICIPLAELPNKISQHFGAAPYFLFIDWDITQKKILRRHIIENPYIGLEKAKGLRVAELIIEEKTDRVILKENLEGKGPAYAFQKAGVIMDLTECIATTELVL